MGNGLGGGTPRLGGLNRCCLACAGLGAPAGVDDEGAGGGLPIPEPETPPNTFPVRTKPPLTESPEMALVSMRAVTVASACAPAVGSFRLLGHLLRLGKRGPPDSPQTWQKPAVAPPPSLCASMNMLRAQDS